MEIEERDLVERVKQKQDITAFHNLVLAHQKRIYSIVRRIVQFHEDSEDLVQETFLRAFQNIGQLRETDRFGSWLSRIAVNMALDYKKERYKHKKISIEEDYTMDGEELMDEKAQERTIQNLQAEEIRRGKDQFTEQKEWDNCTACP